MAEEAGKFDTAAFDAAAVEAEAQLREMMKAAPAIKGGVITISDWWRTWYLKAGHKRLGRIIAKIGKE